MAVNNFAPAEYGGYVSGVESGGGGTASGVIEYNGGTYLGKSYNELLSMLTAGEIPRYISHFADDPEAIDDLFILTRLIYDGDIYIALFNCLANVNNIFTNAFIAGDADSDMMFD